MKDGLQIDNFLIEHIDLPNREVRSSVLAAPCATLRRIRIPTRHKWKEVSYTDGGEERGDAGGNVWTSNRSINLWFRYKGDLLSPSSPSLSLSSPSLPFLSLPLTSLVNLIVQFNFKYKIHKFLLYKLTLLKKKREEKLVSGRWGWGDQEGRGGTGRGSWGTRRR